MDYTMPADYIRSAHGAGAKALAVVEDTTASTLDELSQDTIRADTERGIEAHNAAGRPFERGNRAAKGKKPGLAVLGQAVAASDPRYRSALRKARTFMRRRVSELAQMHGGAVSAGVCALLADAALARAASRVLHEMASQSLDAAMFVQAAGLADKAAKAEITAVGLAQREAEAMTAITDDTTARRLATQRRLAGGGSP